jgi:hypothetical protein
MRRPCALYAWRLGSPLCRETGHIRVDEVGESLPHVRWNSLASQCLRHSPAELIDPGTPSLDVAHHRHRYHPCGLHLCSRAVSKLMIT